MTLKPNFPTKLHHDMAGLISSYFSAISFVDTVLVVNSCARGVAVPDSDLDFAILVKPGTSQKEVIDVETEWNYYLTSMESFLQYKQASPFAHLHLDIIYGHYIPMIIEPGEPIDFFEVEIGNQIHYAAPMNFAGEYFKQLQNTWLPYYHEDLRLQRARTAIYACQYDLDHITVLVDRELYFHAFSTLTVAFQKYFQALFITHKTYPIAYNKWIKEQIVRWLKKPELYFKLPPILSICDIESREEILKKAHLLRQLLSSLNSK